MNLIYGGSFDPIHLGHLHLIESVTKHYHPKNVFVVPTGENPLKERSDRSAKDRFEMARLAVNDASIEATLIDFEAAAPGPSYTIETLEKIQEHWGGPLLLVVGDDAFIHFPRWHRAKEVLQMANLCIVKRDEVEVDIPTTLKILGFQEMQRRDERIMHSNNSRWIESLSIEALPFSSTELRETIAKKWENKDLTQPPEGLPEVVWAYIKEKKLYSVRA